MSFAITVQKRGQEETADAVRKSGRIPAVLYGPETKPVSVSVQSSVFQKLYAEAGESTLIDLSIDGGAPTKVLIQDLQHDPVKGSVTHIDFRQINMSKEMTTAIDLNFVGEPAAVKELGGTLMKTLERLTVKCLPKDLVSQIDVDLSVLKTFDVSIRVSDLVLPNGIKTMDNPDMTVAKVTPPLTEDQLKAMESSGTANIADIEVVAKEKKEEAADAEAGDKKE